MSSSLKAVDLTGATVGQKFTLDFSPFVKFDPATRNPMVKAHLSLFNESGCGLQLMMVASGQGQYLPAGAWTTVDLEPNDSHMDMVVVYTLPNPPVSQLGAVYFGPGEEIHGNYTLGNSPIGIGGSVTTTGTASSDFFNVKDISFAGGAKGDGVTDDTAAIAAARLAASINGGIVFYPQGTYVTGPQIIYTGVTDMGSGTEVTRLLLKAGSNADLFSSNVGNINLSAALGSGSAVATINWAIYDMTLDGNRANQSGTSYVLRTYSYGYRLQNVNIVGGFTGGLLVDYYGPFPSATGVYTFEWYNLQALFNNGIGVQIGGPTDSLWIGGFSAFNVNHNIHITPHASQILCNAIHAYTPELAAGGISTTGLSWLIEGSAQLVNCIGETSDICQVAIITSSSVKWIGGNVFAGVYNGVGFQIGQLAGNAPYLGQINQSGGLTTLVRASQYTIFGTALSTINNAAGAIWFANDGGGLIDVSYFPNVGIPLTTGAQHITTNIRYKPIGTTRNGTFANDGGIVTSGPIASNLATTDIAGDTSGTAHCYEDEQGSIKRVIIVLDNYKHVGAAQPQFVLPVPFLKGATIHVGNINTNVACWQGGVAQNINVVTAEGTFTPNPSIGPFLWGEVTAAFDRVLLPDLMGSVVGRAMIEIVGN